MSTYGQKGGEGPTRGKKATIYAIPLPDGSVFHKRVFRDLGPGPLIATGFTGQEGKPCVVVWADEPAWEGDFGRLKAMRAEKK